MERQPMVFFSVLWPKIIQQHRRPHHQKKAYQNANRKNLSIEVNNPIAGTECPAVGFGFQDTEHSKNPKVREIGKVPPCDEKNEEWNSRNDINDSVKRAHPAKASHDGTKITKLFVFDADGDTSHVLRQKDAG